jgi:outer membrane protein assembly factor BamB
MSAVSAPANADLIFFDEDGGKSSPLGLYNFDLETGISTLRATVEGTQRFFSMTVRPSDGTVFCVDSAENDLYTIDVDTGSFTYVAPLGGDDFVANITFDPTSDILYGLERNQRRFFEIDQITGQRTPIGTTSFTRAGLAFSPDGTLYGTTSGGKLYQVDPATAVDTLIGGVEGLLTEDATFTSSGQMFVCDFGGEIYTYNTSTGVRQLVGTTGMGSGLLGIIEIPEPATICLLCLGGLGLLHKRKRA